MNGDRIIALRKEAGVKQGEFAAAIGASPRALRNWEKGANEVPETVANLVRCIERLTWPVFLETLESPE